MIKIGISTRTDSTGQAHPYLVIIDDGGKTLQSTIALPSDRKYINPPAHPLYGDLTKGPSMEEVAHAIMKILEGRGAISSAENKESILLRGTAVNFIDLEPINEGEKAFEQISALSDAKFHMETA